MVSVSFSTHTHTPQAHPDVPTGSSSHHLNVSVRTTLTAGVVLTCPETKAVVLVLSSPPARVALQASGFCTKQIWTAFFTNGKHLIWAVWLFLTNGTTVELRGGRREHNIISICTQDNIHADSLFRVKLKQTTLQICSHNGWLMWTRKLCLIRVFASKLSGGSLVRSENYHSVWSINWRGDCSHTHTHRKKNEETCCSSV